MQTKGLQKDLSPHYQQLNEKDALLGKKTSFRKIKTMNKRIILQTVERFNGNTIKRYLDLKTVVKRYLGGQYSSKDQFLDDAVKASDLDQDQILAIVDCERGVPHYDYIN